MRVAALDTDRSFWPEGDSAEPSGPWNPRVERAIEICVPAGRIDQPDGVTGARRVAAAAVAGASASAGEDERHGQESRRVGSSEAHKPRGPTFDAVARTEPARPLSSPRMGTASRSTAAPATMPQTRVLPAVATVVGVAALLRLVYEPWFLNYDARYALVWARDIADGADAGLHRPLRAHPAPARDAGLAGGGAVRPGRRLDHGVGRPALLRRAGLAHLPARRGALLRPGRRRGGARGADAPGARARRAARLPGHPVRRPDRVGGAARGAPAAPRRARARPARGRRADAPGGVGARRALRALRLARRVDATARRSTPG